MGNETSDGTVRKMYYGTSRKRVENTVRNGFQPSRDGTLGPGVYVSDDRSKALRNARDAGQADGSGWCILTVNVNVGRMKKIDYQGHPLQKDWMHYGFDTAWVPPNCGMVASELSEYCVADPARIEMVAVDYEDYTTTASRYPALRSLPRSATMRNAPIDGTVWKMYHGTSRKRGENIVRNGFQPSRHGMLGPGVYVSVDRRKVLRYARDAGQADGSGWCILTVNVNVGRVKKIDRQGHPLQKTWMDNGFDTAWVPPNCGMVPSELSENCVADPGRIEVVAVDHEDYTTTASRYPALRSLPRSATMRNAPIDGTVWKMYHGTSRKRGENIVRNGFQPSRHGMLGPGVYVSVDRRKVLRYARDAGQADGSGWCILTVNVNVGRVKKIDRQGHPLQKTWMDNGFDTAWVPPNCGMVPSELSENCVADPGRIEVVAVDHEDYTRTAPRYPVLRSLPREEGLTP